MIYTDQLMRELRFDKPPSRIISLVPSLTELVCDLGLEEQLLGITKFCIHPEHIFRSKIRIGGTKNPSIEKIPSLQPDLIIANKEENRYEDIEQLEKITNVYVTDISTLDDAIDAIKNIGAITNSSDKAELLVEKITSNFKIINKAEPVTALYLVWKNPYLAAGGDTFIHDMMIRCGFINTVSHFERYPEVPVELIQQLNPELVLLSSEPYPFSEKHIQELQNILPSAKILLVNGEYFSWYGSRLVESPGYFNTITSQLKSIQA